MHEHELKKNAVMKGQVLLVCTSCDKLGDSGQATGAWWAAAQLRLQATAGCHKLMVLEQRMWDEQCCLSLNDCHVCAMRAHTCTWDS